MSTALHIQLAKKKKVNGYLGELFLIKLFPIYPSSLLLVWQEMKAHKVTRIMLQIFSEA